MRYLDTGELVGQLVQDQALRLNALTAQGVVPWLEVQRDEVGAQDPGVRSYSAELRNHAKTLVETATTLGGLMLSDDQILTIKTLPSGEIAESLAVASAAPYVDGILPMSPMKNGVFAQAVANVDPVKDIDAMNPLTMELGIRQSPLTPRAVKATLETAGQWRPDLRYVLQGLGVTVGSHVDRDLRLLHGAEYETNVRVVNNGNSHTLPERVAEANVVILAAGLSDPSITVDMLHPDLSAVVGVGRSDIHPDAYTIEANILLTPPHLSEAELGIGALTAAFAWDEVLTRAEARAQRLNNAYMADLAIDHAQFV